MKEPFSWPNNSLSINSDGIAAQFISDHYGAPAMLMALLFGIALNFLSKETYCNSGISFSATVVLRFGIILLGMKISWHMAVQLGFTAIIVILGLAICFSYIFAICLLLFINEFRYFILCGKLLLLIRLLFVFLFV